MNEIQRIQALRNPEQDEFFESDQSGRTSNTNTQIDALVEFNERPIQNRNPQNQINYINRQRNVPYIQSPSQFQHQVDNISSSSDYTLTTSNITVSEPYNNENLSQQLSPIRNATDIAENSLVAPPDLNTYQMNFKNILSTKSLQISKKRRKPKKKDSKSQKDVFNKKILLSGINSKNTVRDKLQNANKLQFTDSLKIIKATEHLKKEDNLPDEKDFKNIEQKEQLNSISDMISKEYFRYRIQGFSSLYETLEELITFNQTILGQYHRFIIFLTFLKILNSILFEDQNITLIFIQIAFIVIQILNECARFKIKTIHKKKLDKYIDKNNYVYKKLKNKSLFNTWQFVVINLSFAPLDTIEINNYNQIALICVCMCKCSLIRMDDCEYHLFKAAIVLTSLIVPSGIKFTFMFLDGKQIQTNVYKELLPFCFQTVILLVSAHYTRQYVAKINDLLIKSLQLTEIKISDILQTPSFSNKNKNLKLVRNNSGPVSHYQILQRGQLGNKLEEIMEQCHSQSHSKDKYDDTSSQDITPSISVQSTKFDINRIKIPQQEYNILSSSKSIGQESQYAIGLDQTNQGFIMCEIRKVQDSIQVDAHVISKNFFDLLPKTSINNEMANLSQSQQSKKQMSCIVDLQNKIKEIEQINDQMRFKMLVPHFKQHYEFNNKEVEKYSLFEIIQWYFVSSQKSSKLVFKFQVFSKQNKKTSIFKEVENSTQLSYINSKSGHEEIINKYLQIELFRSMQSYIMINIQDVSDIITQQQKLSDSIYLEAIELNFSHEQMTPLNSIIASSKIVYKRYIELCKQYASLYKKTFPEQKNQIQYEIQKNVETIKIIKAVRQQGQNLWFYNQSQIQRMKIDKDELDIKETREIEILNKIQEVILPFQPIIQSQKLNLYIGKESTFNYELFADWDKYQLVLFNIVQNALKYNQYSGEVIIKLNLKSLNLEQLDMNNFTLNGSMNQNSENFVLETEVIDSGVGIDEHRQQLLFKPFSELKKNQDLNLVKDGNIGMGLACSLAIAKKLGGDITLKESQRGFTVFAFQIPVRKKDIADISICRQQCENFEDHEYVNVSREDIIRLQKKFKFREAIQNIKQDQFKKIKQKKEVNFNTILKRLSENCFGGSRISGHIESSQNTNPEMLLNGSSIPENSSSLIYKNKLNEINESDVIPKIAMASIEQQISAQIDNHMSQQNIDKYSFIKQIKDFDTLNLIESTENKKNLGYFMVSNNNQNQHLMSLIQLSKQEKKSSEQEIDDLSKMSDISLENSNSNSGSSFCDYKNIDYEEVKISNSELQLPVLKKNYLKLIQAKKNQKSFNASNLDNIAEESQLHESASHDSASLSLNFAKKILIQQNLQKVMDQKQCSCEPTILVVDDNQFNILVIKNMVQEYFGLDVEEASNGQIAVQMYEKALKKECKCQFRTYQLIFMDIQMPIMDGKVASKKILQMIYQDQKPFYKNKQSRKNIIKQELQKGLKGIIPVKSQSNKDSSFYLEIIPKGLESIKISDFSQSVSLDSGNPLGNLFYNNGERVEDFADKNELTHIIALTAHASKQTEEECLRIGMKELVAKPVSQSKIQQVMYNYYFRLNQNEQNDIIQLQKSNRFKT